jgi:prevent-host-death family protein
VAVPLRDRPTARYRFYGFDGTPIYIGIAVEPEVRWAFHKTVAHWWPLVDQSRTIVDWYPSRPEAETAEVDAIEAERPAYNVLHTERSARSAPRPSRWAEARAAGIHAAAGKRRILLSIQEARAQLKNVFDVVEAGRHVILIRHSAPAAVLLPIDWYREATAMMGEPTEY